ncbi:MAG: PAS domain S-box protein [Rhodoferax sp.]|uniref:PAS domain S-box protein n=1 Tax=Rhodoferax sp. TaxID=50421 RepID=UPI001400F85B|nr:PAS domain S-box protein [Rhodoferax sp.]NDP39713.1 PAS domain S-box protein [Rhodoferax sp.]
MNKFKLGWNSLKTRITLINLGIFLIGIWSLTFFVSAELHDDLEKMLGQQQFSTASLLAEEIDQELADRLQALALIGKEITPAMLQRPESLQTLLQQRPLLARLFNNGVTIAGLDGTVLADFPHQPGRIGANFSERDYAIAALKGGKATIGKPVRSKLTQNPSFVMAVPIKDAAGAVIGFLAGVVNLNQPNFLDLATRNTYGRDGDYFVVAPQHRLNVTTSNKNRIMATLPAPGVNPALDRYAQGREGSDIFINPLGVEVLGSAKRIPAAGWYVAITLPTQQAFAPIHAMQQRMLLAAALLTVLAAALTWWLLGRQLAPLLTASTTLHKLDVGDPFPPPLAIARDDEVGHLIKAFNQLLTSLQQRDAALQESEARFRTLIEGTPEPVVVHRHGLVLYVNPAAIGLFGATSRQELVGKPLLALIHPDCHAALLEQVRRSYEEGAKLPTLEEKIIRLDGSVIDVEATRITISYDGQKAIQVLMRDVTERKHLQLARDEALARLQKIADRVPGMVYQYLLRPDGSSCFPFASEGIRQIYRVSSQHVSSDASCVLAILHPDDLDRVGASIEASARTLTPWQQEYRVKFADGTVRWLHGDALPEQQSDGAVLWHGLIADITERKLADDQLRTFSRIVEQAPMTIVITDLAGSIEYANPWTTQSNGYTREELYGQNPRLLASGLTAPEVYQSLWQTLTAGEVWCGEFINRKKGGDLYVEHAVIAPVLDHGNTAHYVALKQDITERKRTEQALQDSLRDKVALLNEVHHRVKNNLQVITSLLRLEAGRSSESDTRCVLAEMQGRIRAMALLHESLYRSGTFASVDLGAYLGHLARQAFRAQSSAMVRLQLELASVQISLDQATPCGLLVNELLSNCLKHGFPEGRGGDIRIELRALGPGDQWLLRVSDTGVGLAADFESRRSQSLGLQLVGDLARQIDGTLQIEPGPGAAFAVTFEIHRAEPPTPAA